MLTLFNDSNNLQFRTCPKKQTSFMDMLLFRYLWMFSIQNLVSKTSLIHL